MGTERKTHFFFLESDFPQRDYQDERLKAAIDFFPTKHENENVQINDEYLLKNKSQAFINSGDLGGQGLAGSFFKFLHLICYTGQIASS